MEDDFDEDFFESFEDEVSDIDLSEKAKQILKRRRLESLLEKKRIEAEIDGYDDVFSERGFSSDRLEAEE